MNAILLIFAFFCGASTIPMLHAVVPKKPKISPSNNANSADKQKKEIDAKKKKLDALKTQLNNIKKKLKTFEKTFKPGKALPQSKQKDYEAQFTKTTQGYKTVTEKITSLGGGSNPPYTTTWESLKSQVKWQSEAEEWNEKLQQAATKLRGKSFTPELEEKKRLEIEQIIEKVKKANGTPVTSWATIKASFKDPSANAERYHAKALALKTELMTKSHYVDDQEKMLKKYSEFRANAIHGKPSLANAADMPESIARSSLAPAKQGSGKENQLKTLIKKLNDINKQLAPSKLSFGTKGVSQVDADRLMVKFNQTADEATKLKAELSSKLVIPTIKKPVIIDSSKALTQYLNALAAVDKKLNGNDWKTNMANNVDSKNKELRRLKLIQQREVAVKRILALDPHAQLPPKPLAALTDQSEGKALAAQQKAEREPAKEHAKETTAEKDTPKKTAAQSSGPQAEVAEAEESTPAQPAKKPKNAPSSSNTTADDMPSGKEERSTNGIKETTKDGKKIGIVDGKPVELTTQVESSGPFGLRKKNVDVMKVEGEDGVIRTRKVVDEETHKTELEKAKREGQEEARRGQGGGIGNSLMGNGMGMNPIMGGAMMGGGMGMSPMMGGGMASPMMGGGYGMQSMMPMVAGGAMMAGGAAMMMPNGMMPQSAPLAPLPQLSTPASTVPTVTKEDFTKAEAITNTIPQAPASATIAQYSSSTLVALSGGILNKANEKAPLPPAPAALVEDWTRATSSDPLVGA